MTKLLSPARRRWAYRVTGAALIVAGIYGLIDGAQRDAWLILAGALGPLPAATLPPGTAAHAISPPDLPLPAALSRAPELLAAAVERHLGPE